MLEDFEDIRPYEDNEVQTVVARLLRDREFLNMIGRFRAPRLQNLAPGLTRTVVRLMLSTRFQSSRSVRGLQERIVPYMARAVRNTTDGVTFSGLENLPTDRACLFLSNHRDIVFDPAIVNYGLWQRGLDTTRIAIGDNLTAEPRVADLMRLNKSFIVKRNLSNPREMRDVYLQLSRFINRSIRDNHSIWLAQREGRAKDGIDRTDPAIIKMLAMAPKREGEAFADTVKRLNIVPVAISYEYDPCDIRKARELAARARGETVAKGRTDDMESIIAGLVGYKGRVHVAFGEPIAGEFDNPREVAPAVDQQIIELYRLFPISKLAYDLYRGRFPDPALAPVSEELDWGNTAPAERTLQARLETCDPILQPYLLAMYANPLLRKYLGDEWALEPPAV
ncbi:1-acyl-sn-glycerol-3-phosphate acyltransferase [Marinobacteraceae bacterium S3BR75-40.1]